MDARSDRSFPFPLEEGGISCRLDDVCAERNFPLAETCVVGGAVAGFLTTAGVVILVLDHTLSQRPGFRPLLPHGPALGVGLLALSAALVICAACAYAIWRVARVLDMASRYREHQELCAYEEMRQSFRSSQKHLHDSRDRFSTK